MPFRPSIAEVYILLRSARVGPATNYRGFPEFSSKNLWMIIIRWPFLGPGSSRSRCDSGSHQPRARREIRNCKNYQSGSPVKFDVSHASQNPVTVHAFRNSGINVNAWCLGRSHGKDSSKNWVWCLKKILRAQKLMLLAGAGQRPRIRGKVSQGRMRWRGTRSAQSD